MSLRQLADPTVTPTRHSKAVLCFVYNQVELVPDKWPTTYEEAVKLLNDKIRYIDKQCKVDLPQAVGNRKFHFQMTQKPNTVLDSNEAWQTFYRGACEELPKRQGGSEMALASVLVTLR